MKNGIIIYATEEAKKRFEGKLKKDKKKYICPSCEIKEIKTNDESFDVEVIKNKN
jgi:hypothetical protein